MIVRHAEELRDERSELGAVRPFEPLGRARGDRLHEFQRDGIDDGSRSRLEARRFLAETRQFRTGNFFEPALQGTFQRAHTRRRGKAGAT